MAPETIPDQKDKNPMKELSKSAPQRTNKK